MSDVIDVDQYRNLVKKRTLAAPQKKSTGNKFNNTRVEYDGMNFDSKRELERWKSLKMLEAKGVVTELKRQVTFKLEFNNIVVEKYRADFCYYFQGKYVVEDSKGYKTPDYRRKRKWMEAFHGIRIKET